MQCQSENCSPETNTCVEGTPPPLKPIGATCASPTECQSENCSPTTNECVEGTPPPLKPIGADCASPNECQSDNCSSETNTCVESTPPPLKSTGSDCQSNSECMSNYCTWTNEVKLCQYVPDEQPCGSGEQCLSGFCDLNLASPVCKPSNSSGSGGTKYNGMPCTNNDECIYKHCKWTNGQSTCQFGQEFDPCSTSVECASNFCDFSAATPMCKAAQGGKDNGAMCGNDSECMSSHCNWHGDLQYSICETGFGVYHPCSMPSECASGNCGQYDSATVCLPSGTNGNGDNNLPKGSPCDTNSNCASHSCHFTGSSNGVCDGKPDYAYCMSHNDCQSGNCWSSSCQPYSTNGPGYGPGPNGMEEECSVGPTLTHCSAEASANGNGTMSSPVAITTAICSCALNNPVPLPARCSISDKVMFDLFIRSNATCEALVMMSMNNSNNNNEGGGEGNNGEGPPAGCVADCMTGCSAVGSPQSPAGLCDCFKQTCPSTCNSSQDNAWTLALYSELRTNRPFCLEMTAGEKPPPVAEVTCNAGQYLKNKGGSNEVCHTCPAGKFTRTNGNRNKKCPRCPRGTYQPEEGRSTCLMCPKGFRSRGQMGGPNCFHKKTGRPMRPSDLLTAAHPEHPGLGPH